MKRIYKVNPEHLLIDLRHNPGGRISHAISCLRYLTDSLYSFDVYRCKTNLLLPMRLKGLQQVSDLYFKLHAKKVHKTDTVCYRYVVKPQNYNVYKGKISVLINHGTYSAAVLMASALQWRPQTRFIGSETGGTADGCNAGVFYTYRFKFMPFYYRLPLYRFVQHPKQIKPGRGIIPDIRCDANGDELLLKNDKETQQALLQPF